MMESYVVAVAIEKAQSFLYHVLQAPMQEKQSNSNTLQTIIQSSTTISKGFYYDLGIEGNNGCFSGVITQKLLTCSGKCIFIVRETEENIMSKLDKLFCKYYRKFSGQLLLKYVCFKQNIESNKLTVIKESTIRLKQKACLNTIIKRNQDVVFNFNIQHEPSYGEHYKEKNTYPCFTLTINDLYSDEDSKNSNRFRIAVIKADLDGMGDLFKSLSNYETYSTISQLISRYISLDALHDQTQLIQQNEKNFRLFPLYVAGDDIFFAVPISQLVQGIHLCRALLRQINAELEQINALSDKKLLLTMSIGVDFTYNREPIRYYYERVQFQLDNYAKQANALMSTDQLVPASCMKVSINRQVLYLFDFPNNNNDKQLAVFKKNFNDKNSGNLYWNYLINDVKRLQKAESLGFATHHFLYGLLSKIKDPSIANDKVRYSNAVLYHMIPHYLTDSNQKLRNLELAIITSLLKKIIVTDSKGKNGSLSFESKQRNTFEGYVRLLLLFSDPRFDIVTLKSENKNIGKEKDDEVAIMKFAASAKSVLINKGLKYLHEINLLSKSEPLTKVFILPDFYYPHEGRNVRKVEVYRTLRISQSLFHRLKDSTPVEQNIKRIAEKIAATNPETSEEIEQLKQTCKDNFKAPPKLYFDEAKFNLAIQNSKQNVFNEDFIDSLLIFYLFKDLKIEFKSIHKTKKSKSKYINRSRGKRH